MYSMAFVTVMLVTWLIFMQYSDRSFAARKWIWGVGAIMQILAYGMFIFLPFTPVTVITNIVVFAGGAALAGEAMYKVFSQELFPTMLRGTAQGISFGVARFSLGIWSFMVPMLLGNKTIDKVAMFHSTLFLLISGVVGFFGMPDTSGKSLEQIESERARARWTRVRGPAAISSRSVRFLARTPKPIAGLHAHHLPSSHRIPREPSRHRRARAPLLVDPRGRSPRRSASRLPHSGRNVPRWGICGIPGWVKSDASTQIAYAGRPLKSRDFCHWIVEVVDEQGDTSHSPAAHFSMGLHEKCDWKASWIAADLQIIKRDKDAIPPSLIDPGTPALFRKEFELPGSIRRATVYASARGLFELRANGHRVGDDIFAPEWTDYDKRIHYRTYDITALLKSGRNALGATLGDGWWSGYVGWQETRARYGSLENSLIVQLVGQSELAERP